MRMRSLLLVLVTSAACGAPAAESPQARRLAGLTEPILDATLNSPVPGVIARINFEEGRFVEQGQVLMELDKRLEELEADRRRIVMETRKVELDRLEKLMARTGAVSQEDLDKKRLEYREGVAEYELAAERVRKREIMAPFAGYVADLFDHEPGEGCRETETPLLRLVDTRRCLLVCNVEAALGHGLKVGQAVKLEIDAGTAKVPRDGQIRFISPVVDPASGLLKIKILFENGDGRIRPGVAGVLLLED